MIASLKKDLSPDDVARLSHHYVGAFALEFAYEEWAEDYRSSLHTTYLQVIERAVAGDTATGHFDRGIDVARRALDVSPASDQLELSLLRLYGLSGSHSAAAEQYAHYASSVRNLGMEPPTLESLVG